MIEEIHLKNEGSYGAEGTKLEDLKKLNFIFGSNGSGKTTISRVIEGTGTFTDCQIKWKNGNKLETRVYSKHFVETHFDEKSSIKGIYTFGEKNIEITEKINALRNKINTIEKSLDDNTKTLSRKQEEKKARINWFTDYIWSEKKKFDKSLDEAFKGLNHSKNKFYDSYFKTLNNTANISDMNELREKAKIVFSNAPA